MTVFSLYIRDCHYATIDIIFFKQSLQGVLAPRFAERFSKKYSFKQYWGWRVNFPNMAVLVNEKSLLEKWEDGRDGRVTTER